MNEKSCKSSENPKKGSKAAKEVPNGCDPSAALSPSAASLPPIQVNSSNRNEFRAPSVAMLSPSTPASVQMMSPQTSMQSSPPSVQMMSPPSASMMSPPMPKPQLSPKQSSMAVSVGPPVKPVLNQMPSNGTNVNQMVVNSSVNTSQTGLRLKPSTTTAQNSGQGMTVYTQPSPQIPNSNPNFIQSQINPNNNQYFNQNLNNNSNNQQFFNCNTNVYYNYNQFQPMNAINAWNHNSGKSLITFSLLKTLLLLSGQMNPQYQPQSGIGQQPQQMPNRVPSQPQMHQQWSPMQGQQQFPSQQWNYQNNNYINQNQYPNQYINPYINAQQIQWQNNQMRQMKQQFHQNAIGANLANQNILTNVTNIANNTTSMPTTMSSTMPSNGCQTQEVTASRNQPSSVIPKCPPLPNSSVANTQSVPYQQINVHPMQKCQNQSNHTNAEVQCGSVESTAAPIGSNVSTNANNRTNMRADSYQRTLEYVYQHPMLTEAPVSCEPSSPANVLSPAGSCKVTSSCSTPKLAANAIQTMATPMTPMPQQCLRPASAMSAMSCRSTSTQLSTNMVINDLNSTLNCLIEESRFLQMSIN